MLKNKRIRLSTSQTIILGFAALILVGTLLLMLPISTVDKGGASFGDALFTTTSAVCVTGLVVQDTATYWSSFGQAVILTLIQIGGLGVVTASVGLALLSGRRIGLKERSAMQEAISAPKVGGIVRLTGFVLRSVFVIELIGAIGLAPSFCKNHGVLKGIWYSFFHSISAFCNAGFDLIDEGVKDSSLMMYGTDVLFNIVIMLLIIIGGLGFLTWDDIKTNKFRIKKYRMQSKVILTVSGLLILLPAIYFFFFEYNQLPIDKRLLFSIFQSVTARTAGFNTADLTLFSEVGIMVMVVLMLIGGSPGSTAGGLKTTTVAVMGATALSSFRKKGAAQLFGRRLNDSVVRNAAAIVTMYIFLLVVGTCVISAVEGLPFMTCIFETASAVGTVGLTLGVTPTLGAVSRTILIMLMFFGRVGGLTLIFATLPGSVVTHSKLPEEKITVG